MEGGQSGIYLRLTRASSGPRLSIAKTCRDETKMNISARSQWLSSEMPYIREYSTPSNNPRTLILGEKIFKIIKMALINVLFIRN